MKPEQNIQNIAELLKQEENESVEFKPSLSQISEIIETLSAFANKKGGKILIGISNSGKVLGLEIGKDTIEQLTNKIKDNTEPKLYPEISVLEHEDKKLISVGIKESKEKPVLAFGRAYKRVGKSTLKMSNDELKRTILENKRFFWDEQICEDSRLDDIDWDFITSFFIPKYELINETKVSGNSKELLEALGCIKNNMPTNAAILLFSKTPQKFFMNAYIALARYKGEEVGTERYDYKEFNGNLFQQVDNCNKYIKENITTMSRLLPGVVERQDIPEYPLFAIRELIVNAVSHRDYSDQRSKVIIKMFDNSIEYYNPGGLPKEITPENITTKQFSRNPIIAKVFSKIRYNEELGEGWDKIIKEHKAHPLNPQLPKITADEYSINVTLFSTKNKFKEKKEISLTERQKKIIDYLNKHKRITTSICASLLNVSADTALRELSELSSNSLIEKKGVGRGIYYAHK